MLLPWPRRVGAVLFASLLLQGCRAQDDEPAVFPPPTIATAAPDPEPRGEAQDPPPVPIPEPDTSFSGPSEAPAGLADDVPIHPNATLLGSMSSPSHGTIVNLTSAEPADAVFQWYLGELPRRGWILDKQSGTPLNHLLTAHKDKRKATVLIKGSEKTVILLTVAPVSGR